jgi:hypothetical protein
MDSRRPSGAGLFCDFAFPGLRFAGPGLFSYCPYGTKSAIALKSTMVLKSTIALKSTVVLKSDVALKSTVALTVALTHRRTP